MELFGKEDLRQIKKPLSPSQRETAVRQIIRNARLGAKYCYTLRETCVILHLSYDEMNTILCRYRLDAVLLLSVYRIPWYAICSYLLDAEEDNLEEALDEYLQTISRRN